MLVHTRQASFDFNFSDVVGLEHLSGILLILVFLSHNQPPKYEDGRNQG